MKRYQVYLNPGSVSIIDDFEKISAISRSKLIRQMIDKVAVQLVSIVAKKKKRNKKYILDSLAGFVDLKTDKQTNFAQHVDDIYFSD